MATPRAGPPALPGVEHRYVDAGEFRMHVAEAGPSTGDPLVLIHGWPQNWFTWRGVIGPLAETYRVLAVDLRGFGWSDAPPTGYEKEQLATDVLAALDELGVERFRLAGHDWGGFAAFLMALREPERVERLMVFNIIHPWIRADGGIGERLKALTSAGYQFVLASPGLGAQVMQRAPIAKNALTKASVVEGAFSADEIEVFAERWRDPARARATTQVYRSFLTRELRPILEGKYRDQRLKPKTLLVTGSEDPVVSIDRLGGYEEYADDMTVEELPDTGHWTLDERPHVALERMREFFA